MDRDQLTTTNLDAGISHYGYPVAHFDKVNLLVGRRLVETTDIYWDAEYAHYIAVGFYVKKDGTAGNQRAKALMGRGEVPSDVLEALDPLR